MLTSETGRRRTNLRRTEGERVIGTFFLIAPVALIDCASFDAEWMCCRGRDGDEIEEILEEHDITTSKPRRRSNSHSNVVVGVNGGSTVAVVGSGGTVKSKFEVNEIDEEAVDDLAQPKAGSASS